MRENYDFGGWATRNGLKCSDGRTIKQNAFIDQDGERVSLIWNHDHSSGATVLGHADLENRPEGVYAYCKFNGTESGKNAKELVSHGDVTKLSIWANQLVQDGGDVLHGCIREVSLVLAGANPGATIDYIAHDGFDEYDAKICTGETIELFHSDDKKKKEDSSDLEENETEDSNDSELNEKNNTQKSSEDSKELDNSENNKDEENEEDEKNKKGEKNKMKMIKHSDEQSNEQSNEQSDETLQDVVDTMDEKQKKVLYALVGLAANGELDKFRNNEGGNDSDMKQSVFDNNDNNVMAHSELFETAIKEAKSSKGSLKESVLAHAADYGIENIDWLFPEAKYMNGATPEFIKRTPDEWVSIVMNGVHHTPFSRVKSIWADLRPDSARAKGYSQKGKLKKEEVFGLLKRATTPTTIYKKQKLDRDDIIDITDFDVVSWLKTEMRMMLDEEIARAIIFGDGRDTLDDDKISEENIRPVCSSEDLFAIKVEVSPKSGESQGHAIIDAMMRAQDDYEGSGGLTLFTSNKLVTDIRLMEDTLGHRLYNTDSDVALAMGVSRIVKVPASIIPEGILGVALNLNDYNVGADKGGSIEMFDDFDIDYNQQKYLIETRCSGTLTKPFSAIVLKKGNTEING